MNKEKELISRGIINIDEICVCCGEQYAPYGMFCEDCKNKQSALKQNYTACTQK